VLLRTSDSIRVFPSSLNLSFVFLSKKKPLIRLYSMHPRCFKAWLPLRALQGSDQLIMFAAARRRLVLRPLELSVGYAVNGRP
jgi:hypothetical protein